MEEYPYMVGVEYKYLSSTFTQAFGLSVHLIVGKKKKKVLSIMQLQTETLKLGCNSCLVFFEL